MKEKLAVILTVMPGFTVTLEADKETEIGLVGSSSGGNWAMSLPTLDNAYAVAALTLPKLYVTDWFPLFLMETICSARKLAVS